MDSFSRKRYTSKYLDLISGRPRLLEANSQIPNEDSLNLKSTITLFLQVISHRVSIKIKFLKNLNNYHMMTSKTILRDHLKIKIIFHALMSGDLSNSKLLTTQSNLMKPLSPQPRLCFCCSLAHFSPCPVFAVFFFLYLFSCHPCTHYSCYTYSSPTHSSRPKLSSTTSITSSLISCPIISFPWIHNFFSTIQLIL